jgi:hypothetical protein
MLDDDLNFANNGEQGILNPGHTRHDNEAINVPHPTNAHGNIGGPSVGRVPKASIIDVAPTIVDRTEAYYRIQNLKILKQCKKYKDSLMDCQSSLKVAIDALKAALQKNESIPNYLDIIKIKVMLNRQFKI